MALYRKALRPLLFRLSPDRSHEWAQAALRWPAPWRALGALEGLEVANPGLKTRYAGIDLANPVGLAAGFDKNGDLLAALSSLGFGFITIGSIMPEPRFGNPFPRLVRYPETGSMADAMGLPSKGLAYAVERLRRFSPRVVPVFANIGGFSADAIAAGVLATEPYVDAVEISLICPNVKPEGGFDEIALLRAVLARLEGRRKPVTVRIPNDTVRAPERLAALVETCLGGGVAGLKVGAGRPVPEPRLGTGQGTLHGRAIFTDALANVARTAALAAGRIPIKGNGGVASAADVVAMQRAGAVCVDLFSAFVYEGWTIARDINRGLPRPSPARG